MKSHKVIALVAFLAGFSSVASATEIRMSHQWTLDDIRHKVAMILANAVDSSTTGLKINVFPNQSLFKAKEQYERLRDGELDMTLFPLAYAAPLHPAYNLTLMPGLITDHDHAHRLALRSPFMHEIEKILEKDNIMVLIHGYLAGGLSGREKCITAPNDVRGMRMRGAGDAFNEMLEEAGASITSIASPEILPALQKNEIDGVATSSSSVLSFRILKAIKCYTPPGQYGLWYMYHPVLMNMDAFNRLSWEQQEALLHAAARAEIYYTREAKRIDDLVVSMMRVAGVQIASMTKEDHKEWMAIAKDTVYARFREKYPDYKHLLDMAQETP